MGRRLGINTHNLASLSNRTFATAALGFVLTVRDGHPTTPLVLISPIFGSWREEIPAGANNVEEMPQPGAAAWPVRAAHFCQPRANMLANAACGNVFTRGGQHCPTTPDSGP